MTNRSRRASAPLGAAAATAAIGDAAHATTVDESTDFGDDFTSRTLLPIGTDVVNGNVFPFEGDPEDNVTFQGLLPGGSFDLTTTNTGNDTTNVFQVFQLEDDTGLLLQGDSGTAAALSGTIPASGELHFRMFVEGTPNPGVFYTLNLSAPLPEPVTAAMLGGGLLAAAVLRRLRTRDGS
jgi:hypothetical protein